MARIRSIHPGFFTDEDLVAVSMAARLLFLGLGVEADDKGIFEWKPLTIKMRVFPGDNLDVADLLTELEGVGAIRRYDQGGKSYGAIRNFRRFQKPKTPNDIHPAPPEILLFVGLVSEIDGDNEAAFPPIGETFPPKGEKPIQMEDGGGKMEGGRDKAYAFVAGDVRLTKSDYRDWRGRFHGIPDFDAELTTLSAWLKDQPAEKRKRWFATGASWLNRRHQEAIGAATKGHGHDSLVC